MRVDRILNKQNGKVYTSYLLRHAYRDDQGNTKHRTLLNLTKYPPDEVAAIELALKMKNDLTQLTSIKSFQHTVHQKIGAVYLLKEVARELGIIKALGFGPKGKLILWQVLARLIAPTSKLGCVRLARQHAALEVLDLSGFCEDHLYLSLDWAATMQDKIEQRMIAQKGVDNLQMFLYDVTSSYLEGEQNELAEYGYNRDGKKGKKQIVIGLLTDGEGDPVSVQVYQGNTSDTSTFQDQIDKSCQRFGIRHVTFVGDKGMIKSDQQTALQDTQYHYITSITKAQIKKLMAQGTLQLSLFDEEIKEVITPENIRYVYRRNPFRAEEIECNRQQKQTKIEQFIKTQNQYLAEHPKADPQVALRKVKEKISKLKTTQWLKVEITEPRVISLTVDQEALVKARQLDGCYVVKSDVSQKVATAEQLHDRYKELSKVEQAFKDCKTQLLEVRPLFLRKAKRTKAHVFCVMLSYKINRYLEQCWKSVDMTVAEALEKLSAISVLQVENAGRTHNIIPNGDEAAQELLRLANVQLPTTIKLRSDNVYTRKNISTARVA